MRPISISVTEASRNFADCINRVRYQGATFTLQKNGVPVALIVPAGRNAKNEQELPAKFASAQSQENPLEPGGNENPARKALALEIW